VKQGRSILLISSIIACGSALPANAVVYTGNLLADPSFETGTAVPSGSGGWATLRSGFSQAYAHSGQWSLASPYNSAYINAPAVQSVSASPGQTYTASVWAFTPVPLPAGLWGSLLIDFEDSQNRLLGGYNEAPQTLDQNSPANTWIPLSITMTAPSQTATIWVELTLFNFSSTTVSGSPVVYFDDASLTAVPEPSGLVLSACGGLAIAGVLRLRGRRG